MCDGTFYEIVWYDRKLSDVDVNTTLQHLINKHGVDIGSLYRSGNGPGPWTLLSRQTLPISIRTPEEWKTQDWN
jgi:hypothetical protein